MISQSTLTEYLGKSMSQICPNGYANPDDNHCAHFVSHVMGFRFGYTCGQMKTGPGPSVNIRVHEVFRECPAVDAWSQKPVVLVFCLVFITHSSNVDLKNRTMTNVPRKHVGIYFNGSIWHYSNLKHSVVFQTPEQFSNHYPAPNNSMFYGRAPLVASL